ncbi:hypothetical protein DFP72DRAFT_219292 [Ephemerocybe angulata]|uniref:Uncharacterized protein n=1 Tax=Ephemerocybe angulata TaxID=980116 RepID=A0A8H6LUV1_9AGAR|nr:hypothetical protein DFP72DRAFT_219292 [Tulosesus angulatus]
MQHTPSNYRNTHLPLSKLEGRVGACDDKAKPSCLHREASKQVDDQPTPLLSSSSLPDPLALDRHRRQQGHGTTRPAETRTSGKTADTTVNSGAWGRTRPEPILHECTSALTRPQRRGIGLPHAMSHKASIESTACDDDLQMGIQRHRTSLDPNIVARLRQPVALPNSDERPHRLPGQRCLARGEAGGE